MPVLPADVSVYRRTPAFTEESVPLALTRSHDTKAGVWGRIVVATGKLRYEMLDRNASVILSPGQDGVIAPEAPHKIAPVGKVTFHVEFLR